MTISKKEQQRLSRLSLAAEGDGPLPPGTTVRGPHAAAEGRRLLAEALGGPEKLESEIRRGPRSLDGSQDKGVTSPLIRVRIPLERDAALARLEIQTRRKRPELVREAIDLLLARYDEQPDTRSTTAELQDARDHLNAALEALDSLTPHAGIR